jgi:hypothetical protein
MLLAALLLLEAILVGDVLGVFIAAPPAPPFDVGPAPGPSTASLFMVTTVVPGLILAVLWRWQRARRVEARQAASQQMADLERASRLLYVQPDAPLHIARAAYAAAMKRHHPDLSGGDDRRARELNWAMQTFRAQHRALRRRSAPAAPTASDPRDEREEAVGGDRP